MKKYITLILLALATFGLPTISRAESFFATTASTSNLRNAYEKAKQNGPRLRILLVPGHDKDYWGTEYRGVKEADVNHEMALELYKILSSQKELEVIMTRDTQSYNPEISSYLEVNRENIKKFRDDHKAVMSILNYAGVVELKETVYHNIVNEEISVRLYGINKWANENSIDFVLHIHFNDTPERRWLNPGPYSGFSVYVPDSQLPNAEPGIELGRKVFEQMKNYFATSNMANENGGIIEDQKLIALGAMNTLNPAAVLIEYGYIYEPQIIKPAVRPLYFKEMATQTALGINNFLSNSTETDIATVPYKWQRNIKKGERGSADVFALQLALTLDGYYPPKGKTKNSCPVSGNYGNCTSLAVARFQKDFGLSPNGASVGPKTREKLNALYYNN